MENKKNCWVIPTDKPSRLQLNVNTKKLILFNNIQSNNESVHLTTQHIFITSDEEIKEGVDQWYLDKVLNEPYNSGGAQYSSKQDVIILTTDQDLIKDGVQAIDDGFLEWFVNNPSCEEVNVEDYGNLYNFRYLILIPREEPKMNKIQQEIFEMEQELGVPSNLRWHNSKPKQELERGITITHVDKQETLEDKIFQQKLVDELKSGKLLYQDASIYTIILELVQGNGKDEIFGIFNEVMKEESKQESFVERMKPLQEQWQQDMDKELMKQETTLKEAAERLIKLNRQDAFIEGAKWQQKRSYSEEEIISHIEQAMIQGLDIGQYRDLLIEQFKNK